MNEEIKEILDYLKRSDKNKFGFEQGKLIDYEETQLLLDYITSLQQDLDKAIDTIEKDRQFYKCRMNEYVDLKKENERLKEEVINVRNFIKLRNVNTETEDKALLYNLQLENINKIRYLDYKSRCEKATEYIKSTNCYGMRSGKILLQKYLYDLLNILNGSDENE